MGIKTGKNNSLNDRELEAVEFEKVDSDYLKRICDSCYRNSIDATSYDNELQGTIASVKRPKSCSEKVECVEKAKNYCGKMMQILVDAGFSPEDVGSLFTGQIDAAQLLMTSDEREINQDINSRGLSKGYNPRKDKRNPRDFLMENAATFGDEDRNEHIMSRNSNQRKKRRGFRTQNFGDSMSPAQESALRALEDMHDDKSSSSKNIFTKMSKSDWFRIGQQAGWIKSAQEEMPEELRREKKDNGNVVVFYMHKGNTYMAEFSKANNKIYVYAVPDDIDSGADDDIDNDIELLHQERGDDWDIDRVVRKYLEPELSARLEEKFRREEHQERMATDGAYRADSGVFDKERNPREQRWVRRRWRRR